MNTRDQNIQTARGQIGNYLEALSGLAQHGAVVRQVLTPANGGSPLLLSDDGYVYTMSKKGKVGKKFLSNTYKEPGRLQATSGALAGAVREANFIDNALRPRLYDDLRTIIQITFVTPPSTKVLHELYATYGAMLSVGTEASC